MFDSLMPAAAVAAAAGGGPHQGGPRFGPSQYLSTGRGPYPPAYAAAATPFMSLQQHAAPAFASPSPPSSATPDASNFQTAAVLASVARGGAPSGSSNNASSGTAGVQGAEGALGIFDTRQRNPGEVGDMNSAAAAWDECNKAGGGVAGGSSDQQAYLTASAAALMGLYASVGGVANSNALVAAPSAAGAQLLRSSAGGPSGLLYTREILVC